MIRIYNAAARSCPREPTKQVSYKMLNQRTIAKSVHAIGVGVHSAEKVRLTLRPADENSGIRFVRSDLPEKDPILAHAENVSDTMLSTSIGDSSLQVATVEHLMAALWGMGIDNIIIELSAPEVPILDGSAAPFMDLIVSAGIVEQKGRKQFIRIKREVRVTQGDGHASLKPYAGFKGSYTFVSSHRAYENFPKSVSLDFSSVSFVESVGGARSFGLMEELSQAQAINKCLGSSLENAVGVTVDGVVNPEGLRFDDEFVRHKLLDAIGDLYLLGKPILGEFEGYASGHSLNNKLARALLRCEDAWDLVDFDVSASNLIQPIIHPEIVSAG